MNLQGTKRASDFHDRLMVANKIAKSRWDVLEVNPLKKLKYEVIQVKEL